MKQTAVEWLVKELTEHGFKHLDMAEDIIEEAKEMERQQIIDAYHINSLETKWGNIGEQYYNETFNK